MAQNIEIIPQADKNTVATDGLDLVLGEEELPPLPPSGVFDARFLLPTNPIIGSLIDYRSISLESINWNIYFQPGSGGYPINLTWDSSFVNLSLSRGRSSFVRLWVKAFKSGYIDFSSSSVRLSRSEAEIPALDISRISERVFAGSF